MPLAPCFQGMPKSLGMPYFPVKFTWCSKLVRRILDVLGLNNRVNFRFFFQQSSVLIAKEEECM